MSDKLDLTDELRARLLVTVTGEDAEFLRRVVAERDAQMNAAVTYMATIDRLRAALEARDELLAEALYPPPAQGWDQWRKDVLALDKAEN